MKNAGMLVEIIALDDFGACRRSTDGEIGHVDEMLLMLKVAC